MMMKRKAFLKIFAKVFREKVEEQWIYGAVQVEEHAHGHIYVPVVSQCDYRGEIGSM